jgi:manganese efflux pump family protein
MEWITLLILSAGLAMDSFAVSLAIGGSGRVRTVRSVLRVALHMGLFQGAMAFVGWVVGASVAEKISHFDHWVALALLVFIGGRMIRSGLNSQRDESSGDPSRGPQMALVCLATSIDALAVGLSLAMLQVPILAPSLTIGIVTVGFSLVGLMTGGQLGLRFGKSMEVLGGLVLAGIGINIALSHLL